MSWNASVMMVASFVFALTSCGGGNGLSECASGVECGNGCCANAAEVCVTQNGQTGCLPSCASRADCATGCCAPLGDGMGNIVGPYVCQDSNVCCYTAICPGASCCVADGSGNEFCASQCANQSQCGGGSICQPYDFSHTTCGGPMACGPS